MSLNFLNYDSSTNNYFIASALPDYNPWGKPGPGVGPVRGGLQLITAEPPSDTRNTHAAGRPVQMLGTKVSGRSLFGGNF